MIEINRCFRFKIEDERELLGATVYLQTSSTGGANLSPRIDDSTVIRDRAHRELLQLAVASV
jgi:hypothetical protein